MESRLAPLLGRQRQLDGLRTVAVGLVFAEHMVAGGSPPETYFTWWATGPAGVRLFFVLSGFLITGILLDARTKAEAQGVSIISVWRAFYIRRALRIFPLAYAALALGSALHLSSGLWWYLTYLGNVYVARTNHFDGLGHFWSLAVEEQFYLVWPVLLLAVPKRAHLPLMASVVLTAGVCRGFYVANGHFNQAYALPWTRMDALAAGGVLSLLGKAAMTPSRVGAVAILLLLAGYLLPLGGVWATVNEWGAIALCGSVVVGAASGYQGAMGRLLASRPMVYLGTISYGLYVWHPFFLGPVLAIGRRFELRAGNTHPLLPAFSLLGVLLTVLVAAVSWHFLERPFNELKRYVPYVPRRKGTALGGGSLGNHLSGPEPPSTSVAR